MNLAPTNLQKLYAELERDEGLRLKPYRDTVGKQTIGVGHNLDAKPISERAASCILEDDVADVHGPALDEQRAHRPAPGVEPRSPSAFSTSRSYLPAGSPAGTTAWSVCSSSQATSASSTAPSQARWRVSTWLPPEATCTPRT